MSCRNIMKALVLAVATALPTGIAASPLPVWPGYVFEAGVFPFYPGDSFDWPAAGYTGYSWLVDIASVTATPTPVADFTVTNILPDAVPVQTFQVFGNCGGTGADAAWKPKFTLLIGGAETAWTAVSTDPCGYHDYVAFDLPVGPTRFTVLLDDAPNDLARYVDMRFGNVIPAVPLPPAAALLLGAWAGLCLVAGRRRTG